MEGNKESSSSSSFVDDLFRPKENPDTQIIFDAIFRPAAYNKVRGESSEFQKNGSETQKAIADQNVQGQNQQGTSKDKGAEENVHQQFHFHYSSSIYYGGPDLYNIQPQPAPSPFFTTLNKDGGEDEPGYASRGNWWMGSLYY